MSNLIRERGTVISPHPRPLCTYEIKIAACTGKPDCEQSGGRGGGRDWRNGASSVAFLLPMMLRVLASPRALRLDNDYLRPVYMEKSCPKWKGHPPTRATLSEPPFQTSMFFLILTLFKVVSVRRVTLLLGTSFLHLNGAQVSKIFYNLP